MKTCNHCGSTNPDAANFCLDCGKALSLAPAEPTPTPPIAPPAPTLPLRPRVAETIEARPAAISPTIEAKPVAIPETTIPGTIDSHTPIVPETLISQPPISQSLVSQPPVGQPPISQSPVSQSPVNQSPVGQSPNWQETAGFTPEQFQSLYQNVLRKQRKADIMFILDCTGSMQGEIDAVRDAITNFADTIEAQAVRARVGLIEFRDRLIKEEHRVLLFEGQPFTSDPKLFRQQVAQLRAKGGGDEPESSLDAVMLALEQPFDPEANKVLVLITDAPPHMPDRSTPDIETVVNRMQAIKVDQVYLVMRTQDTRHQVYLKLLEGTRGLAFEIGTGNDFSSRAEDFKRTLMALGKTISTVTR